MNVIFQIARYEAKLQSRDWINRVLALLAIVGCLFFQLILQNAPAVWYRWSLEAIPSSVPLLNAYLFNLVQSFLVIFAVTDIPRRESRLHSIESLRVRPFENDYYSLGKLCGVLLFFALLNTLSVFSGMLVNLLGSRAPFDPGLYVFYFITLNFPSLLFMTGFSFLVSGVTRSRFFSQVLLLFFLLLSITWLPGKWHGTYDFLGSSLPNVFSDETGHVDIMPYLLQRLVYFFVGLSFFFLSSFFVRRIPNNRHSGYRVWGFVLLVSGLCCIVFLEGLFARESNIRESYRESFRCHWRMETGSVKRHEILIRQAGSKIHGESTMVILNDGSGELSRLVLFLNPGLKVDSVEIGGALVSFERDNQVLLVDRGLSSGDSVKLRLVYNGGIDDLYSDLDLPEERRLRTSRGDLFYKFGRRTSFTGDDFLLLPPSCCWYPVTIPTENPDSPWSSGRDFTFFRLGVISPRQRVILSQGVRESSGDTLFFTMPGPSRGITLCGGDYELKRLRTNLLDFELYYFRGHDFFSRYFQDVDPSSLLKSFENEFTRVISYYTDSIEKVFNGQEWYGSGSRRFLAVETPLSFDSDYRFWKDRGDRVQPGMLLLPERGVGLDMDYIVKYPSRKISPGRKEWSFQRFVHANFLSSDYRVYRGKSLVSNFVKCFQPLDPTISIHTYQENPCFYFSLFWEPSVWLYAVDYPFADAVFKYIRSRASSFKRESKQRILEKEQEAYAVLVGRSVEDALREASMDTYLQREVFRLVCEDLLNRITVHVTRDEFCNFLNDFYECHHGKLSLEVFFEEFQKSLGVDLRDIVFEWYTSRHLARFKIKEMEMVRYRNSDGLHEARLQVMNTGEEGGVVSVVNEIWNPALTSQYLNLFLSPGEAKEFRYIEKFSMLGVNTGLSLNLPIMIFFDRVNVSKVIEDQEVARDSVWRINDLAPGVFVADSSEIIVDNEDSGFYYENAKKTLIDRFATRKTIEETALGMKFNTNIRHWTRYLAGRAYGDYIKSYYYKMGGSGDSKAVWETSITRPGRYRVMVLTYDKLSISGNSNEICYYYTVYHGDRNEKVVFRHDHQAYPKVWSRMGDAPVTNLWVSLGEYDFPAGKARVVLSDKGSPDVLIIADAVKWVYLGEK